MSTLTALSVLSQAAAILRTAATGRRAVSDDPQHHWQRGSVLLRSILAEVRAPVCARLSAQKRWRSSTCLLEYAL